jgi:glycosyltransferase involved in cell wall biosynthesis
MGGRVRTKPKTTQTGSAKVDVSVLMAAKDAEPTIRQAIASVKAQTLTNWELLVADDGSTDRTAEIVKSEAEEDCRIHLVRGRWGSPAGARNGLLPHAKGSFIAILDSDDLAFPTRFEKQISFVRSHPRCAAVGSAAYHFVREGNVAGLFPSGPKSFEELDRSRSAGGLVVWCHSSMMWRRTALNELDGFDEGFLAGEDAELANRAIYRHDMKILGIPDPLVWFRLGSRSESMTKLREQRMVARYLEGRNQAWLREEPYASYSEFLLAKVASRTRLRWFRHDFAALLYRKAGYDVARGRKMGLWRLPIALLLHPRYVVPKLRKQRARREWAAARVIQT